LVEDDVSLQGLDADKVVDHLDQGKHFDQLEHALEAGIVSVKILALEGAGFTDFVQDKDAEEGL
jgi:hypothetical protein